MFQDSIQKKPAMLSEMGSGEAKTRTITSLDYSKGPILPVLEKAEGWSPDLSARNNKIPFLSWGMQ
jgi:hypothetical protein